MYEDGSTIAGWRITRELHQGSMAITFEVSPDGADAPDGRYVLKLMFLRDPSFQERLRRVGQTQRELSHPNLVDIIDVVDVDGSVGVVSPFVPGVDLGTWAQERHPVGAVVVLFRKLVDALVAAHERGLVHRNLKPQKVRIAPDGTPHLFDFMLGKTLTSDSTAALTQMGTTFGTPQYMSPEQFRGAADVDARTDLFSLGCLLFELLTGRRAFDGKGLMDIYKQVADGSAPPPSSLNPEVPPALDALVADLLATDRDDRPPSARVVAERLDRDPVLRELQGLERLDAPPPPATTTPPPPQRVHEPGVTLTPSDLDEVLDYDENTDIRAMPGAKGPAADITEEVPAAVAAAMSPRGEPTRSSPVPPPPLSAGSGWSNVWLAIFLVLLGALAAVLGLLAAAWVF